jgi:hypothetical protein
MGTGAGWHRRGRPRGHDVRVPHPRSAVSTALLLVPLLVLGAACGDDGGGDDGAPGGGDGGRGTRLTVTGVATRPVADPSTPPTEVPFEGTLDCETDPPTGTGMFRADAAGVCGRVAAEADEFGKLDPDPGRICTEIYGGPQLARITGTVDGTPVNLEIARNDGCGIGDWTRFEFLLGSPERAA